MKKRLFALIFICISLMNFPLRVQAKVYKIDLPYRYIYYIDVEASEIDLIFWEFTCSGNKIKMYLMDSTDFYSFKIWPNRLMLEYYGEELAGFCTKASGQFRPDHTDTYYFIFFNYYQNATAHLNIEITNVRYFYVLVPVSIVAIVVSIVIFAGWMISERKNEEAEREKKRESRMTPQIMPFPTLRMSSNSLNYCPHCGERILYESAGFCAKCGRNISLKQEETRSLVKEPSFVKKEKENNNDGEKI